MYTYIGDRGAIALFDALKSNQCLRVLSLNGNQLTGDTQLKRPMLVSINSNTHECVLMHHKYQKCFFK
jgi:hypothetical protein